jgi:hypothetical protein
MPTADSLYTTIKNTTGVESVFGYLPPHGRKLAPNETITVFGNIVDRIAKKGERSVNAFTRDLERGDIQVLATPSPVLNNAGDARILNLTGAAPGTLGTVDPSWEV